MHADVCLSASVRLVLGEASDFWRAFKRMNCMRMLRPRLKLRITSNRCAAFAQAQGMGKIADNCKCCMR